MHLCGPVTAREDYLYTGYPFPHIHISRSDYKFLTLRAFAILRVCSITEPRQVRTHPKQYANVIRQETRFSLFLSLSKVKSTIAFHFYANNPSARQSFAELWANTRKQRLGIEFAEQTTRWVMWRTHCHPRLGYAFARTKNTTGNVTDLFGWQTKPRMRTGPARDPLEDFLGPWGGSNGCICHD